VRVGLESPTYLRIVFARVISIAPAKKSVRLSSPTRIGPDRTESGWKA
jgi:hypothetical protein